MSRFDKDKRDLGSVVMNIEKRCSMSSLLSWQFPEGEDSAISKSLAEKENMKNHNKQILFFSAFTNIYFWCSFFMKFSPLV